MIAPDERLTCFGTGEAVRAPRHVVAGDLACQLGTGSVRGITWKGTEVIRAIAWPIRDPDWVTMRPDIIAESVQESVQASDSRFEYQLHFQVGDGALDCRVSIVGDAAGHIQARIDMQATVDFATNRSGFTVLHPITGVAGSDLEVTHSDGAVESTAFPTLISPDQAVMDISGLQHSLNGTLVDIRFEGEVFEMEDQRNWSDASYKTYCVPLVQPVTYTIEKGRVVSQSITVSLSGGDDAGGRAADTAGLSLTTLAETAPQIGLAFEEAWAGDSTAQQIVADTGVQYLLARLSLAAPDACLDSLRHWPGLAGLDVDLEIVIPDGMNLGELSLLAEKLTVKLAGEPAGEPATGPAPEPAGKPAAGIDKVGIRPAHVIALPEPYLTSHQPSGPWPAGPTPDAVVPALREAFPQAAIGAGMLTNFTEFNRCRPDISQCDYITHGSTAIVHAADDQSAMETLEALPQVFASTRTIGGDRPCRLGLISIGGRSNPYGSGPAPNPEQIRQSLAQVDPRQRGLFAAAWAVGVLAATTGHSIEAITLAAPCGPFGIALQAQEYPQPVFDEDPEAIVYPLYHIVRIAASMSGLPRVAVDALPAGVVAYGVQTGDGIRLLLANTGSEPRSLALGQSWQVQLLDADSFMAAVRDPHWIDTAPAMHSDTLILQPCATGLLYRPTQDS